MRRCMMEKSQKRKIILIIAAFAFLLVCTISMMATRTIMYGDDIDFHYARFGGIRDAILGGQFPIKYYNGWAHSGGYFGSLFYGDIFLIPFVLPSLIGIPLEVCYFLFLYVVYFAFWVAMYFLAKKYLKGDVLSILCATIFTASNYMFVDVFYRVALGESIAVVFYLVLLLGIYNLLHENYSKPWLLVIAFVGILFSHMTTLFFAAVTLIIVVLVNCKKLFRDKQFWIKSGLALGLFLIVGLYFIASFIELYFADTYNIVNNTLNPNLTSSKRAFDFEEIFNSVFSVGSILWISVILRVIIIALKRTKDELKIIDKFLIIAIVLVFMTSKAFPWKIFDNSLGIIQFPWRLNFIISILLSIVLSLEIKIIYSCRFNWSIFVTVFVLLILLVNNNCVYLERTNTERDLYTYYNRKVEWYPVVTQIDDFKDRNIYDHAGNVIEYTRGKYTTDIDFSVDGVGEYYIVPLVYFKGYTAVHVDEDGKRTNLAVSGHTNGMMVVKGNGKKGKVAIHYAGTTVQKVSFVISFVGTLVSVVGAVVYAVRTNRLRRRQCKETEAKVV
ncbi:MAG: hypothetical protein J6B20_02275 [Clostridia bacterium]|nr:hypothetical protein [Clostridia bacterium]